jgi:hypothetical protein
VLSFIVKGEVLIPEPIPIISNRELGVVVPIPTFWAKIVDKINKLNNKTSENNRVVFIQFFFNVINL